MQEFKTTCRQTSAGKKVISRLEAYGQQFGVDFFQNGLGRSASKRDVKGGRLRVDMSFPVVGRATVVLISVTLIKKSEK